MWIFYALGSLFSESLETATDKIALVKNKKIDSLAASFLRLLMVCGISGLVGILGILGPLKLLLLWPIILVGVMDAVASLAYTYLLKHIEATGTAIVSYFSPLLYLAVDTSLLKTHLLPLQIAGILLLVLGGIMFVFDPKKFRFKKEFTPIVWGLIAFNFIFGGVEYYSFKYYAGAHQLNEISFIFSFELVCIALLAAIVIGLGKYRAVWRGFTKTNYFGLVGISKSLDLACMYLWLHAITLASVSQVNATSSFYPLMLIAVVYLMQKLFKLKAEEKFSRGHLAFKLVAVVLLCAGGFLIR